MIYHIVHEIGYRFPEAVVLDPHVVRLSPRQDTTQSTRRFALSVVPHPAGQTWQNGLAGPEHVVWFSRPVTELTFRAEMEVETHRANPFDFVLVPEASFLPPRYDAETLSALAGCLEQADPGVAVRDLAHSQALAGEQNPVDFLQHLCGWLHRHIERRDRRDGPPLAPAETLRQSQAACRDMAVLFVACCRCVGLAARFVSGYHEGDPALTDKELHAWAEVYLPGGGWRGIDPSIGLFVADRHVALAAAPYAALAAPVTGTYRGNCQGDLTYRVTMTPGAR